MHLNLELCCRTLLMLPTANWHSVSNRKSRMIKFFSQSYLLAPTQCKIRLF